MTHSRPKTPARIRRATPAEGITDGLRITQARLAAGMTQEQAARAFGLCVQTYAKWESKRTLKPVELEGALAIFATLSPGEGITETSTP